MNETIVAACILHNICIMSDDQTVFDEDVQQPMPNGGDAIANAIFADQDRARGNLKRLRIARRMQNGV